MRVTVFITAVFNLVVIATDSDPEDYTKHILFATKTPYETSRTLFGSFLSDITPDTFFSSGEWPQVTNKNLYPQECEPSQLSMVLRHGTRYPSGGDVKRVSKLLTKLDEIPLTDEFSTLNHWNNDFTAENEKKLGDAGAMENFKIAKRVSSAFNSLFEKVLIHDEHFEFMSSDTQRTIASAASFLEGLADSYKLNKEKLFKQLELRNDLLRFFATCEAYKLKIEDRDDAIAEFHNFKHGSEMQEAAKRVSRRMTGDPNLLDTDDLRTIWVICGFETALRGEKHASKWCDAITTEESHVLEYTWDLKSFWRKSYGYTLNFEQSCPLLSDIMSNLHQVARNASAPRVSLYFGHAETLLPLQALLGIFQDDKELTASNFKFFKDKRCFRSSLFASFAANIALVQYKCKGEQESHSDWPKNLDSHMVQLFANEHVVPLPFTDKSAISMHEFETHYYQYVHHCDFNMICENGPHDEL